MEKSSATKLVPGAKKIEDCCPKTLAVVARFCVCVCGKITFEKIYFYFSAFPPVTFPQVWFKKCSYF